MCHDVILPNASIHLYLLMVMLPSMIHKQIETKLLKVKESMVIEEPGPQPCRPGVINGVASYDLLGHCSFHKCSLFVS